MNKKRTTNRPEDKKVDNFAQEIILTVIYYTKKNKEEEDLLALKTVSMHRHNILDCTLKRQIKTNYSDQKQQWQDKNQQKNNN